MKIYGVGIGVALVVAAGVAGSIAPRPPGVNFSPFAIPPLAKALSQSTQNIVRVPGTEITTGTACANSPTDGASIGIEGSAPLPTVTTRATVYLNGWYLKYRDTDHHVARLRATILHVRQEGNELKWLAAGWLTDSGFDKPTTFCYWYTVVMWEDLTAVADNSLVNDTLLSDAVIRTRDSAMAVLTSYRENPAFSGSANLAVLPLGFWFSWYELGHLDDHHVLQAAYTLFPGTLIVNRDTDFGGLQPPALPDHTSHVNQSYASWQSHGIIKDDSTKHVYSYAEANSLVIGNDVGVMQAPFSIVPSDDVGGLFGDGCIEPAGGERTDSFRIEAIPFQYAVPVLTGWDLQYACSDEHVKEIGVWIRDFTYTPMVGSGGVLTYRLSSILCDDDCRPGHLIRQNVAVLGLRPIPVHP
ncbi:hypothetical protein [Nitrospira sp. Nam74]